MKIQDDSGNVVVEFVATTIIFLIPIAYIAIAALQVATSYIQVQNAARAGARVFVTSPNESSARALSTRAIETIASSSTSNSIKFLCSAEPCLTPKSLVTIQVQKVVDLNLPAFLGTYQMTVTGLQSEIVQVSR